MKGFFKQHSYSVIKNLVNQIVISLFGAFLSIIAINNNVLSIVISAFAVVFYLFLIYTTTWEIGSKDRISVDVGKKSYRPHTGLLISLVSNIPAFLLALLVTVFKVFVREGSVYNTAQSILRIFFLLLEGMFTGIMMTVKVSAEGTTLIDTWWAYFIIIIPAIAASWIAYYAGHKNFRLIAPLFDKKNKK